MKITVKNWIIIGSSRGLGAALVGELLQQTSSCIIGIARTKAEEITDYEKWVKTGRYQHIQMDIASSQCRDVLKSFSQELSPEPIGVIFNAAYVERDLNPDQSINYTTFDQINWVGINGLGHILAAFEAYFHTYGGILVGISSFWGSVPPLFLPWLAYPASKAYLNIVFRCLRVAWRKQVNVVLVNIGNIEEAGKTSLPTWIIPTYSKAAKKIVHALVKTNTPKTINYPLWHAIVYHYILRFVPESFYSWIFQGYFKLESSWKKKNIFHFFPSKRE
jgi:NAD(P)-dependent dehydrogenase (short-subunit alcohol dehydrogenase family)